MKTSLLTIALNVTVHVLMLTAFCVLTSVYRSNGTSQMASAKASKAQRVASTFVGNAH